MRFAKLGTQNTKMNNFDKLKFNSHYKYLNHAFCITIISLPCEKFHFWHLKMKKRKKNVYENEINEVTIKTK